MRVMILGGTRFIGRAIAEELAAAGHELCYVHRGRTEPDDLPPGAHIHAERAALGAAMDDLLAFHAYGIVDAWVMTRADAEAAVPLFERAAAAVVLSSADVYRAYSALRSGAQDEPVPLDEDAPVRTERYPYRNMSREEAEALGVDMQRYDKLDVEEVSLAAGATVCRLPFVFGERDPQRREDFILRRVRAGRSRIPIGAGSTLLTRGYVRDVARGVRLALESENARGDIFNLGEPRTWTVRTWFQRILDAAGSPATLVTVPDDALPPDLAPAGVLQHLLLDTAKARAVLGYASTDPNEAVRRSVAWHLAHPPPDAEADFSADDAALAVPRA
jgi:nucleoside-diphosphate-sugar epimerase